MKMKAVSDSISDVERSFGALMLPLKSGERRAVVPAGLRRIRRTGSEQGRRLLDFQDGDPNDNT
jgi:hypothetical protein